LTPQRLQFLLRVTPPALESQLRDEVPACVTIAQAILESATPQFGWGSSSLFRVANNPFGIKYEHFGSGDRVIGRSGEQINRGSDMEDLSPEQADVATTGSGDRVSTSVQVATSLAPRVATSTAQPITRLSDHQIPQDYGYFDAQAWEIQNGQKKVVVAQFQRFPNLAEASTAHAQLLRAPRYRPAYEVRHDWKQFAERLGPKSSSLDSEHCGYSTNPSYSAELIKLVELYRLNDPRALHWYAKGGGPA
jgi:flagellum-specific peptidoglycan hydrolase FlgJ